MIESPLLRHLQGYIDGNWTSGDGNRQMEVRNPASGDLLANIPAMGAKETNDAVEAAKRAQQQKLSLEERRNYLERIVQSLTEHRAEIGRILTLEHGKPWKEAQGEVDYAAGFFRFCAERIDSLAPHTLSERPRGLEWTVHYRPAGVVALITPWNFPIGMIAKKLAPAIAADCASIIKPSSKTPLTMIALFTLLADEVGLPPGKVNMVMGPASPISDALCAHPDVRVVSFTGSTEVGRELMAKCAPQLKRVTLELGGNAPFIVFDDADLDKAADNLIANKFRGGGQTCVCANRVLVQRSVAADFTNKVAERVRKLKVGDGMAEDTDIGPLIDANGFNKVRRHVDDAVQRGAELVVGELPPKAERNWGGFYPPSVLKGVQPGSIASCDETFGPIVPLIEFEDEEDAVFRANDTEFGLAAYVFTQDTQRADRVVAALHFQHVGHNTGSGPTPEAPFGGMLQSGFGREGGIEGLFEFVESQTVPRG